MKIKMLSTVRGSPDGINVFTYHAGQAYDLHTSPRVTAELIESFTVGGYAEVVGEPKSKKVVEPAVEKAVVPDPRFNAADHTIDALVSMVRDGVVSKQEVLESERMGMKRVTLFNRLEAEE